jgi:hypothetical protein
MLVTKLFCEIKMSVEYNSKHFYCKSQFGFKQEILSYTQPQVYFRQQFHKTLSNVTSDLE